MIGQTISHYQVLEKLGEGGMGVVYKARDTKLERDVALKFLPAHVSTTKENAARFLQEARAAAALNHANICTIYGVEEVDGSGGSKQMFIAMEYIDGGTLRERLPIHGIPEAASIAIQVGEALQEAHSKGIVHRDIKADNIMLTSKGQVKVMDFGLAKLKGSLKLTKTSSTVGTLGYMAPEQIGGGEVDARSDLFSFGVLIFEMLTGRLPFRGEHEAAMVYSIMNEQPEPLTRYLPEAPPELELLVSKALEKDPAERYQSVAEMLVDFRRLRKSTTRVSRAHPIHSGEEGQAVPQGERWGAASHQPSVQPPGKQKGRPRTIALTLVAAVVIAVGFLLIRTFTGKPAVPSISDMSMTRLTSTGDARWVTISPDGKYAVFVRGEPGRFSLWIRQVATSGEVMVVPPANISFTGTTFSHDGNYIYYTASLPDAPVPSVYRVPVLGGTPPKKIIDLVSGSVSASPDDSQIAFLRSDQATGEEALFIVEADGSNLRKLSSRDGKDLFYISVGGAPAWSPDGSRIACPAGSTVGEFKIGIVTVRVSDGREETFTDHVWPTVGRLAWYPDGSGLLFCAGQQGNLSQIFYISYPGGSISKLTNDLTDYGPGSISVTADGSAIVSTQRQLSLTLWTVPWGDATKARQVTHGGSRRDGADGVAWADSEHVVFTSLGGKAEDLLTIAVDGSGERQLTSSTFRAYSPQANARTGKIFYVSRDESIPRIWVMGLDGSAPRRLTDREDYNPSVSSDGRWLLFDSWRSGSQCLWRMDLTSQDTATLFLQGATQPRISPDGRSVLCYYFDAGRNLQRPAIVDFNTAALQSVFDLPLSADLESMDWSPDGRDIHYINTNNGVSNIMAYSPSTGAFRQVTAFDSDFIFHFAWSPDGRTLLVARGPVASDVIMLKKNQHL